MIAKETNIHQKPIGIEVSNYNSSLVWPSKMCKTHIVLYTDFKMPVKATTKWDNFRLGKQILSYIISNSQ